MKIIVYILWIMSYIYMSQFVFALWEQSEYSWDVTKCTQAVARGKALLVQEVVCLQTSNYEKRAYNIVLDNEFRRIDKMMHTYLNNLEDNPDYYFGKQRQKDFPEWVDTIQDYLWKGGVLYNLYQPLCQRRNENSIFMKMLPLLWDSISQTFGWDDTCMDLVVKKLEIAQSAGFAILNTNNDIIRGESFKIMQRANKTYYDNMADGLRLHNWYTSKLPQKWTSKTKQVHK